MKACSKEQAEPWPCATQGALLVAPIQHSWTHLHIIPDDFSWISLFSDPEIYRVHPWYEIPCIESRIMRI